MCGFVGFADSRLDIDRVTTIQSMMDMIVHRGPDSGGVYSDDIISLGFRRLKIIDMTEVASQPMFNEDNSCVLIFNGEIYNFLELREELIEKGHVFVSNTDSEVVIHAYEEYGIELLKKLRGMFAFAIWDKKNESLF